MCGKERTLFVASRLEQPRKTIKVNKLPTAFLLTSICNTLAIAHENANDGLTLASVTFIRDILTNDPKVSSILLYDKEGWDDHYLLDRSLNMPVTKRALEYWDDYSHVAANVEFSDVRAEYSPSVFLRPEKIAFG